VGQNLEQTRADWLAVSLKGAIGALPVVGSLLGEIVGVLIPQQRLDRLVDFVRRLDEKVEALSIDQRALAERVQSEEFIDLLEDAMLQAARALTSERRDHIAALLKNSLPDSDLSHTEEKRLLWLLNELNDPEIVILTSYNLARTEVERFYHQHRAVIEGPGSAAGSESERRDRMAVYQTFRENLKRLGLIRPYRGKGAMEEWDASSNAFRPNRDEITDLGRLLLRHLDLQGSRPSRATV
jgi:hypothetical protein